jgi:hypothetical protein
MKSIKFDLKAHLNVNAFILAKSTILERKIGLLGHECKFLCKLIASFFSKVRA